MKLQEVTTETRQDALFYKERAERFEQEIADLERKLAAAQEALINAKCELNCLGRDLQEIYDGKRQFPTALLNLEVMDEIASALNGCE